MGIIGETLASQIKKFDRNSSFQSQVEEFQDMAEDPSGLNDVKEPIEAGRDPLHATYCSMQHLVSVFAERVSVLPELKTYYDTVGPAEDEYMPSGPPISPLTTSYFVCWAFFDLRFGPDKETIGTCFLDVVPGMDLSPKISEIVELMQNSRMGIYEHLGIRGGRVLLQDIMSGEEYPCYVPSGYWGEKGQLWLVRVLPLFQNVCEYNVVFNTPYVLIGESKEDWSTFIKRAMVGTTGTAGSYHEFMKYGLDVHYWNEYIFKAYHHHQSDAIFLKGLPDVAESLPHGELQKKLTNEPVRRVRNRQIKIKKQRRRKKQK